MLEQRGIQVAITDHHEPSDLVPEGVPVADPKMRRRLPKRHPGRRGRGAEDGAGAGRPLRPAAPVAPVHRLRHPGHRRRPHAHARREPRAGGRRHLRAYERPRRALASRRSSGTSGAAGKQLTATNLSFSHHPAPERRRPHGRRATGARPAACTDNFERGLRSWPQRLEAVNDQRRAIEAELSEIAKAQAAETLQGPACAGGGRRRLARRREGYRGKPPGEHVRRAGAAVHHRWRRSARFRAQRWAG